MFFLRTNLAQKAITVSFDPSYHGVGRMFSDHKHLTNPQNHFLGLDGWTLTTQRAYRLPKAKKFCCLPLFSELRDFFDVEKQGPTGDILDQSSTQCFVNMLLEKLYKDWISCNNHFCHSSQLLGCACNALWFYSIPGHHSTFLLVAFKTSFFRHTAYLQSLNLDNSAVVGFEGKIHCCKGICTNVFPGYKTYNGIRSL